MEGIFKDQDGFGLYLFKQNVGWLLEILLPVVTSEKDSENPYARALFDERLTSVRLEAVRKQFLLTDHLLPELEKILGIYNASRERFLESIRDTRAYESMKIQQLRINRRVETTNLSFSAYVRPLPTGHNLCITEGGSFKQFVGVDEFILPGALVSEFHGELQKLLIDRKLKLIVDRSSAKPLRELLHAPRIMSNTEPLASRDIFHIDRDLASILSKITDEQKQYITRKLGENALERPIRAMFGKEGREEVVYLKGKEDDQVFSTYRDGTGMESYGSGRFLRAK